MRTLLLLAGLGALLASSAAAAQLLNETVGEQYTAVQTAGVPPRLTQTSPQSLYNLSTAYYYMMPAHKIASTIPHLTDFTERVVGRIATPFTVCPLTDPGHPALVCCQAAVPFPHVW